MSGADFTIELRVYKSAEYTPDQVMRVLEAIFEQPEEENAIYLYARQSKIERQTILEVTGVKRDSKPRPIIGQDLLASLESLLWCDAVDYATNEQCVLRRHHPPHHETANRVEF